VHLLWAVVLASAITSATACGSSADTLSAAIALKTPQNQDAAFIEVTGLPPETLRGLSISRLSQDEWSALLRVAVASDAPSVLGTYSVQDDALRFAPLYPFDPGRPYYVRLDPGRLPELPAIATVLEATVVRPSIAAVPSTVVARVYPGGEVVPANLLRMYIEFSGPMGRKSGVEYIKLIDHAGSEIPGAVLPLDYEFWSPDHTRFTVFFDPGRVKSGILPNLEMGRPLESGRSVTLAISREWRDEHGQPLREDFKRVFRIGPADERPIDTSAWRIESPEAGGRGGVVVTFPEPLDHGLLMRALGITRDGQPVIGDVRVHEAETRWTFTPAAPWRPGTYQLLALDILEDLAGNQIGRAFEVDSFQSVDESPAPQTILIPFTVR
jgi:hypothetical protein